MKLAESKSSVLFRHWIRVNKMTTRSIEVKDTRGKNYLSFSEVSQDQLDFGMVIKSDKGVLIRTQAVATGTPDYIYLRNEPADIVIKYPKFFAVIDVANFIFEKEKSKRRSLTAGRAKDIATRIITLRN